MEPPSLGALRRVVGIVAYPAVVGTALFVGWSLYTRGNPSWIATGAAGVVAGALVLMLERVIPYRGAWRHVRTEVGTDLRHLVFNNPVVGGLMGVSAGVAAMASAWLSSHLGVSLWPHGGSPWRDLPFGLVIAELGGYVLHRVQHQTNGFLWRVHAVHHSAKRLYIFTGFRVHPVDSLLTGLSTFVPLVLLGFGEPAMMLVSTYSVAHLLMQHANVDVRLGPLNWVVSMAEVHRWHHSARRSEVNANYGTILLVWDVLFRTRKVPADRVVEPEDVVGIDDVADYPDGWLGQILSPFQAKLWERERTTSPR